MQAELQPSEFLSSQGVHLPDSHRNLHELPVPGHNTMSTSLNGFLFPDCFLLSLPLNTVLSSCSDSSFPLIKSLCCCTLASVSHFPFSSDLPHFWSSACKAVMIFSFSFWESLLYCLSFYYKISLMNSQSFI